MLGSQAATAASTPGGDYWMLSRTGASDNYMISAGSAGTFIKNAEFYEKFSPSGKLLSSKRQTRSDGTGYSAYETFLGKDGYLYGLRYSYSGYAVLLTKFIADTGQLIWQKEIYKPTSGTGPYGYGWSTWPFGFSYLDADASGNVYITIGLNEFNQNGIATVNGSLQQQAEHTILLKTNSSGILQWSKLISSNSLGTAWNCHPGTVTVDSDGYPQVLVYYDPPAWSGWNSGILRFDPNGNLQWQKKIYGPISTGSYRVYTSANVSTNLVAYYGSLPSQTVVSYPVAPTITTINNSGTVQMQKMYTLASGKTFGYSAFQIPQQISSGNLMQYALWGYAGSDPACVWYHEIDLTNTTTANTVSKQMKITDSAGSGVYLGGSFGTAFKTYFDSLKNKTYLYGIVNSSGTKIFKLATDSEFLTKVRTFLSPGSTTTLTVSPTTSDVLSAVADSSTSTFYNIGSGILNVYNAPNITVQDPTILSLTSTAAYDAVAASATYRLGRRS